MTALLTVMRALILVVLLTTVCGNHTALAQGQDPSGTYTVSGTAPGGQAYGPGSVSVRRHNERFEVVWHIGSDAYAGVGLLVADQFSVAIIDRGGTVLFIAVYRPTGQGGWQGVWAASQGTGVGTEIWQGRQ